MSDSLPSILTSNLLSQHSWLDHGFGTRHAQLDQSRMANLRQTHSNICLVASPYPGQVGEGDALVSAHPGTIISIRTADCVPILLADPVTHSVAAVHAGWRGTAAHILAETISRLELEFQVDPANLLATIGPSIGPCCYEVSAEVAQQIGVNLDPHPKGNVDLIAANRAQLEHTGLAFSNIEIVGGCTRCNLDRFFSYRGEGDQAGRMISFIGVRPAARDLSS